VHVNPHIAKPIPLYSIGWRIIASLFILSLSIGAPVNAQIIIDDEALKQAQTAPPEEQPSTTQSPALSKDPEQAASQAPLNTLPAFVSPMSPNKQMTEAENYTAPSDAFVDYYYANMMNIKPYIPQNLQTTELGCSTLTARNTEQYAASISTDYSQPYWESRVKSDWDFFNIDAQAGKVLVIDFGQVTQQGQTQLGYRYLSNDNTYDTLYEPWSSSKIFAYSAALAKARQQGMSGHAMAGAHRISDLITSINTYEPSANADGNSNAIATYFANVAGRDYLTSLFHDRWLLLHNPLIRFRGAYGPTAFAPSAPTWLNLTTEAVVSINSFAQATDDPGYQGYRCKTCGLNGNKPMTTLAQAEWLKRLAAHDRDPATAHPELQTIDIETLFYGAQAHSQQAKDLGGMALGISRILHQAIAEAIAGQAVNNPKRILDNATQGQWRIFQKIGWGPSETRNTGEHVVLAHVCLPHYQGGREFTIAAQTSHPEALDRSVNHAGIKMQRMLASAMEQLLQ
jgi:hypothetical protein